MYRSPKLYELAGLRRFLPTACDLLLDQVSGLEN